MLIVLITSEYELFANGRGDSRMHLIEPTARMLRLLDRYGAKLTIFAEAGEIMRFRDYRDATGRDDYHFEGVAAQLRGALAAGHDVQLHLHSSYFQAVHYQGFWQQDCNAHDLALLPYAQQVELLARAKGFLEEVLRSVRPDYRCRVFRASNWSMQPTSAIARALRANDIEIDSSVWKHGRFHYPVRFDYRGAHSDLIPWPIDDDEVCRLDRNGGLFEVPIYSELQPIWHFVSRHRIARAVDRWINPVWKDPALAAHLAAERTGEPGPAHRGAVAHLGAVLRRHALKMDFNQCSGRQLADGVQRAERRCAGLGLAVPFVVFGHSRTFTSANERSLAPFLRLVAENPTRFRFGRFEDLDLEQYRRFWRARDGQPL